MLVRFQRLAPRHASRLSSGLISRIPSISSLSSRTKETSAVSSVMMKVRWTSNRFRTNTPISIRSESVDNDPQKLKTLQVVKGDVGLARYLRRALGTSTLGMAGGLTTAQLLPLFLPDVLTHLPIALGCMLGGFGLAVAGIVAMRLIPCRPISIPARNERHEPVTLLSSTNPVSRWLGFGSIAAGMGAILAPACMLATRVDPLLFPAATVLSLCTMGGCVWYAIRQPDGALIRYRGPLYGALSGFVGLGMMSLVAAYVMGPNAFTDLWTNVDVYGGIILFCGITGYDVHAAIEEYQNGRADHLAHASSFFLNFFNLFIRFLHILQKLRAGRHH